MKDLDKQGNLKKVKGKQTGVTATKVRTRYPHFGSHESSCLSRLRTKLGGAFVRISSGPAALSW